MKEYKVLNLTIYKNAYFVELEDKYRNELSKLLLDTFGVPPYSTHDIVRSAITFSYNYFAINLLNFAILKNLLDFIS